MVGRVPGRFQKHPEMLIDPASIAKAFYYLHSQDRSCWTRTAAHRISMQAKFLTAAN